MHYWVCTRVKKFCTRGLFNHKLEGKGLRLVFDYHAINNIIACPKCPFRRPIKIINNIGRESPGCFPCISCLGTTKCPRQRNFLTWQYSPLPMEYSGSAARLFLWSSPGIYSAWPEMKLSTRWTYVWGWWASARHQRHWMSLSVSLILRPP